MKWIIDNLIAGDHIRVSRGNYFHHGVYIGNNEVVHYTAIDNDIVENYDLIEVRKTSLSAFSKGVAVEKAVLEDIEVSYLKSRKEILDSAYKAIGEKGYNAVHNNCEDLANRICYKKKISSQIDLIKKSVYENI